LQISGLNFTLTYPCRLCLFRVLLGTCPFCFLQYTALPACCNCSLFLFRVHLGKCPSPTLHSSGLPALFATCLFFFQLLVYYSVCFFLFSLGRVSLSRELCFLSQGCLWEYRVPLICSSGDLRLPSRLGDGIWRHGSPPGFSI
jgi:hypothetical protein